MSMFTQDVWLYKYHIDLIFASVNMVRNVNIILIFLSQNYISQYFMNQI